MAQSVTLTYSTAGTFTWVAPLDVTSVSVELWGGGGTGGPATGTASGAGGGAGGQYAIKATTVTGGTSHTIVVGALTTSLTGTVVAGSDSTFDSTTVVAKGGAGGLQATGATSNGGTGATTGGVGDTVYAGGSGGNGVDSTHSGGGGGGAGSTGAGGAGSGQTAGTGTSQQGGNGGTGVSTANTRNAGTQAGGGGSGGLSNSSTDRRGGDGAAGYARLTYSTADVAIVSQASQVTPASNTNTLSFTMPSGYSNTGLLVGANTYTSAGQAQAQVTGVTFGGVGLTNKIAQAAIITQNNYCEWWYLDSPSASTANIVVTITGGAGDDETAIWVGGLINVNSSQADATNGGTNAVSTTASLAVTTVADRSVTFANTQNQTGSTGPTPTGTGQIALYNPNANNAFSIVASKTPAGSVTHSWSGGAVGDNWVSAVVSIKPFVASVAAASESTLLMMGV